MFQNSIHKCWEEKINHSNLTHLISTIIASVFMTGIIAFAATQSVRAQELTEYTTPDSLRAQELTEYTIPESLGSGPATDISVDNADSWVIDQNGQYKITKGSYTDAAGDHKFGGITVSSQTGAGFEAKLDLNNQSITGLSSNGTLFDIADGTLRLEGTFTDIETTLAQITIAPSTKAQGGIDVSSVASYAGENKIKLRLADTSEIAKVYAATADEPYVLTENMNNDWGSLLNKADSFNPGIKFDVTADPNHDGAYRLVTYFEPELSTYKYESTMTLTDDSLAALIYRTDYFRQKFEAGKITKNEKADIVISSKELFLEELSLASRTTFKKKISEMGANKVLFFSTGLSVKVNGEDSFKITTPLSKKVTLTMSIPPYLKNVGKFYIYGIDNTGAIKTLGSMTNETGSQTQMTLETVYFGDIMIAAKYPPELAFSDVSKDKWFYDAVKYATDSGIMSGYAVSDEGDGTAVSFGPNDKCTREMVMRILYNMEGAPDCDEKTPFYDVPTGKWYSKAISWGLKNNIMIGMTNNRYGRGKNISREQMMQTLMNYARYKGYDVSKRADLSKFADVNRISTWATDSVRWAIAEGIIEGSVKSNGKWYIKAGNSTSRAETATMFMNFKKRFNP